MVSQINKTILITGAAGFIGYHLAEQCLAQGYHVLGVDNLNDYYDVSLKQARLARLQQQSSFEFFAMDIADSAALLEIFQQANIQWVVNLAAQAGVRYSLTHPHAYMQSNMLGFLNVLEACRQFPVQHLLYASSSSVYGANRRLPFSEHDNVDHPLSLYAASKKSNELMAHTYSHLYQIPSTGLRFFTVYGPWGRPDMAMIKFTRAILAGEPIPVFNQGHHQRDFTYIDDIIQGVMGVLHQPAMANADWRGEQPDPATSQAPWRVYNIGNNQPITLSYYIEVLEKCLGKTAVKEYLPLQAGDVLSTHADISELQQAINYQPRTSIEQGVAKFVDWYMDYYR